MGVVDILMELVEWAIPFFQFVGFLVKVLIIPILSTVLAALAVKAVDRKWPDNE